ncbi:MAG: hypothetical protein PHO01_11685 [Desulfotomaculaceae bacterium]|nr:hypothetical protein [Desulfotomaculaceae bacterium]
MRVILLGFLLVVVSGTWLWAEDKIESYRQLTQAKEFLKEGRIQEATNELQKIINNDPHQVQAYLLLALALQRRSQPDEQKILAVLTKAVEIAPNNPDPHLLLAQSHSRLRANNQAIEEFQKTITLGGDISTLVSAHLGLMAIYKRLGQQEKAQREFANACRLAPEVKDLVEQAEINEVTPKPILDYLQIEDGIHPPLKERVKRLQEKRAGGKP